MTTRLHALYLSEEISGYISSRLSESSVDSGWVERGLLLKGFEGSLSDESIKQSYIIPMEKSINLLIDRGMDLPERTSLLLFGSIGLTAEKLVIFLSEDKKKSGTKKATAFRMEGYTPQDIGRLVTKHELKIPLMSKFFEPNIDYIEQLNLDAAKGIVVDAFALSLPRGKMNPTKWIRESLDGSSGNLIFKTEEIKESPVFALLFSSWILDFETLHTMKKGIASSILIKKDHIELVLWDYPRKYAVFAILTDISLEEITHRYLLPLWLGKKEQIRPPSKTKEVVLDSAEPEKDTSSLRKEDTVLDKRSQKEIDNLLQRVAELSRKMEKVQAAEINRRLGIIEKELDAITSDNDEEHQSVSMTPDLENMIEAFQKRMNTVITKLEKISNRLNKLEKNLQSKDRRV